MLTLPTTQPGTYGSPLIDIDERYADLSAMGRQLAQLLLPDRDSRALVLALPLGGVIVAGEIARALRLSLDVLVAREIAIRPYPAIVAGALSEGGGLCLNRAVFRLPGASLNAFWREARRTAHELTGLVALYRRGRQLPALQRRSVILVDDGLGDGLVQLAAIRALRHMHAARCVVATPYATPAAIQRVARRADQVFALDGQAIQPDARGQSHQPLDDEAAAGLVETYRQHTGDAG
jgi:putative phosphoribosyl transferase